MGCVVCFPHSGVCGLVHHLMETTGCPLWKAETPYSVQIFNQVAIVQAGEKRITCTDYEDVASSTPTPPASTLLLSSGLAFLGERERGGGGGGGSTQAARAAAAPYISYLSSSCLSIPSSLSLASPPVDGGHYDYPLTLYGANLDIPGLEFLARYENHLHTLLLFFSSCQGGREGGIEGRIH